MITELLVAIMLLGSGTMAIDISSKIQSITVVSDVDDMEAGGNVVIAGTDLVEDGTLVLDKQVYISLGYSGAPILNLRGVISDIQTKDTPQRDKETQITVMSPFKNYRKQILQTTYFEDDTPIKDVLELLAGDYMGLPPEAYDFSMMTSTLNSFRIENLSIPEAMKLLAEINSLELAWWKGKLITIGFLEPTIEYDISRCTIADSGGNTDLKIISAVNVFGREMRKDDGERKDIGSLVIPKEDLGEHIFLWYFYVELTDLPAENIFLTPSDVSHFDFNYEGIKNNYAIISAHRNNAGIQPVDVLITVSGLVWKEGKLNRKVVRVVPIPGYETDMEVNYENPFIQDWATMESVGNYFLLRNKYSQYPYTIVAPHNPDLKPNTTLKIKEGETELFTIIVRTIETKWQVTDSSLEDVIKGWEF